MPPSADLRHKRSLRDTDIATFPHPGRRAALLSVLGLAVGAMVTPAHAQPAVDVDAGPPRQASGHSDRDRGKVADPPGNGRGPPPEGAALTDRDNGPHADTRGRGRGGIGSDNDQGARADPVGKARRRPRK
jgi:hypothetical protein